MMPAERGAKECKTVLMLAVLAASVAAAASAANSPAPALTFNAPWWETVTVTIAADGKTQGCEYRTSQLPGAHKACDVVGTAAGGLGADAGAAKDQYTRLTFERRFRPALHGLGDDALPSGDTLIGRQVLALAIDAKGAVAGCRIVAATGDMTPDYGCKEAQAEMFATSAVAGAGHAREGYMSILVYGHAEHIV